MEENIKEKSSIGNGKKAILSSYVLVLLFLFAFGCYGCSYQPPTVVPSEDEAAFTLLRLYDTEWEIDSGGGVQTLPELYGMAITGIVFSSGLDERGFLMASLTVQNRTPLIAHFSYDEARGIVMKFGDSESLVKVSHSSSKDGKMETITFRGSESNLQLYFLKTT